MELVVPDEKLSLAIGRKGRTSASPRSSRRWKLSTSSASRSSSRWRRRRSAPLQQIEGVSETIARSMYRLGFRALEELAEASEQELAAIPGLGGAEAAQRIKDAAETTMERLRQQRIQAASSRVEPLTEQERLLFVRGIGERDDPAPRRGSGLQVRSNDLHREDEDKLADQDGARDQRRRARSSRGPEHFLSSESKVIEQARREAARAAKERLAEAPPS